jgi:cytochrome oxidase Cu insertion factor (SCO1/SenC/PrrC family)
MKARITLAVVFLSAAACSDEQKKPLAPTAPSISKAVTAAASAGGSTVCLRYARDRALAAAELKEKPTLQRTQRLQERVGSMDKLLQDACQ